MVKLLSALFLLIIVSSPFAWVTHLYRCFTEEQWGFLIGGALVFPIAVVHGLGIWFGIW